MTTFEEIDKYIYYYVHDKNDCNFIDADLIYDAYVVWEMAAKIYETEQSAVTFNFFTDWYYRDDEMPQGWNFSRETRSVYYDFIVELLGENWDYVDYGKEKKGVLFFNTRELADNPEKIDYDEAYHLELPYYDKLFRWCKATGDGFLSKLETELNENMDGSDVVTYNNLFPDEFWTDDYKWRRERKMEWLTEVLLKDKNIGFTENAEEQTITFFKKEKEKK